MLSVIRLWAYGYVSQSHQTCGLFTTDINPLGTKSVLHLTHSIHSVIFGVDFTDVFYYSDIAQTTRAEPVSLRMPIATRGNKAAPTVDV